MRYREGARLTLGVQGKRIKNRIVFLTQQLYLLSCRLQLPCKKLSLAVHWWHLNCDNLDFQEQWVSPLPGAHWVTPPGIGNFSPCPGICHCQPLNQSLQQHPGCLPQIVSFPELPWVAAPSGFGDSSAFFISPKTMIAARPVLSSSGSREKGSKACLKDLPVSFLFDF